MVWKLLPFDRQVDCGLARVALANHNTAAELWAAFQKANDLVAILPSLNLFRLAIEQNLKSGQVILSTCLEETFPDFYSHDLVKLANRLASLHERATQRHNCLHQTPNVARDKSEQIKVVNSWDTTSQAFRYPFPKGFLSRSNPPSADEVDSSEYPLLYDWTSTTDKLLNERALFSDPNQPWKRRDLQIRESTREVSAEHLLIVGHHLQELSDVLRFYADELHDDLCYVKPDEKGVDSEQLKISTS